MFKLSIRMATANMVSRKLPRMWDQRRSSIGLYYNDMIAK